MVARAQARAKARHRTAMGLSVVAVIAIVAIVLAITLPSSNKKASTASSPVSSAAASPTEPVLTVAPGAVPTKTTVKDVIVGTGTTVGAHDSVTVNYLGVNYVDCAEFDSSWAHNQVATFSLDQVVPGFTKRIGGDTATGIAPMKVGGRREIIVPPADGYGTTGQGSIKPNEELIFVVDLIATSTPSASPGASAPAGAASTPAATPSPTPSTTPAVSPAASASK